MKIIIIIICYNLNNLTLQWKLTLNYGYIIGNDNNSEGKFKTLAKTCFYY